MPKKPKTGEHVSWKEFFKQWKRGMQEVTPLQQCQMTQLGQIVTLVGVVWGIIFSIMLGYWWMGVILVGGLIVLGVQMLGNWQKKIILKQFDNMMKLATPIQIETETEVKHV